MRALSELCLNGTILMSGLLVLKTYRGVYELFFCGNRRGR